MVLDDSRLRIFSGLLCVTEKIQHEFNLLFEKGAGRTETVNSINRLTHTIRHFITETANGSDTSLLEVNIHECFASAGRLADLEKPRSYQTFAQSVGNGGGIASALRNELVTIDYLFYSLHVVCDIAKDPNAGECRNSSGILSSFEHFKALQVSEGADEELLEHAITKHNIMIVNQASETVSAFLTMIAVNFFKYGLGCVTSPDRSGHAVA